MADAVLLHMQGGGGQHLPRHAGEWLDVIGLQTYRSVDYVETPTPHVDWQTTLSTYGRFPCERYVERRRVHTHNTSLTRVLKWTALSVDRAEQVVWSQFRRRPLDPVVRRSFSSALELAEVSTATDEHGGPSEFDIDSCRQSGGVWYVLSQIARLLSGLWTGSAAAQALALRPILPKFPHQLFELATLGTVVFGLRGIAANCHWTSEAPLAAATGGRPSIILRGEKCEWRAYYQTVPADYRTESSPYGALTKYLKGGLLRPDMWIEQVVGGETTEFVVECKYSAEQTYVATGITQSFAYNVEFPPRPGVRRMHIVVGPEEVVDSSVCWEGTYAVTSPSGLRDICRYALMGELDNVLKWWTVDDTGGPTI